jgi:hypothetical protein
MNPILQLNMIRLNNEVSGRLIAHYKGSGKNLEIWLRKMK